VGRKLRAFGRPDAGAPPMPTRRRVSPSRCRVRSLARKQPNPKQQNSLSEPATVEALLHYLVDDIPSDGLADPKRAYKFPFAACEVLCCELDAVFDALVADDALLDLLFSPLRRPPPLPARAAGYLGRVAGALLLRKTMEMVQYLSFRGDDLVCSRMVRHCGTASVADVLRRLCGADDQSAVLYLPAHTQWLAETPLVESLLARMAYTGEEEVESEEERERRRKAAEEEGGEDGGKAASSSSAGGGKPSAAKASEADSEKQQEGKEEQQQEAGVGEEEDDQSGAAVHDAQYCAEARANAADLLAAIAHTQPSALAARLSRPECVSRLLGRVLPLAAGEARPGDSGEAAPAPAAGQEAEAGKEEHAAPAAAAEAAGAAAPPPSAATTAPAEAGDETRRQAEQHPDELLPVLEVCAALLEPRRSQMVIGGGPGMGGDYGLLGGGAGGGGLLGDDGGGGMVLGGGEGGEGGGGLGGGGGLDGGPSADTLAAVLAYVPALVRFLSDYGGVEVAAAAAASTAAATAAEGTGAAASANGGSAPATKKPAGERGADAQPAKDSDAEPDDDKEEEQQDKEEEDQSYPDPAFRQETTYGILLPPLGRARLRAVELLAALLRAGGPQAADALRRADALPALMRLFEAYPFHNLLHHAFGSVVLALLARGGDDAAAHLLGSPCRLPEWLARLPRDVWPALRPGQPPAQHPLRAGYLGHVTQVANIVLDAASASPAAAALLAESPAWSEFVAGELAQANAAEDVGAWLCGRPSGIELMVGLGSSGGGAGDGGEEGGMMELGGGGGGGGAFGAGELERLAAAAGLAGGGGGSGDGGLIHRYGVLEEEEEEEDQEGGAQEASGGAAAAAAVAADDDDDADEAARALQGLSVADEAGSAGAAASAASDDDVLLASDNEGEENGGAGGSGSPAPAAAAAGGSGAAPSSPPSSSAAATATA
jgi:hypothetical protein